MDTKKMVDVLILPQQIQAVVYERIEAIDAEPVVPPRTDAVVREHGNKNKKPIARDKVVQAIQETT
ncbi:MAG: hypothetical protein P8144_11875, partial [Gammaproteobacteria bacterium]